MGNGADREHGSQPQRPGLRRRRRGPRRDLAGGLDRNRRAGVRRTAAQQARIALAGNLTAGTVNDARDARDRLTQQIQTVEHNDLAYRAIPYEADAHEVGDSTTEAFLNP